MERHTMNRASTGSTDSRSSVHRLAILAIALLLAVLPALAGGQGATPAPGEAPTPLEAMLARVPAALPGLDDPSGAVFAFADIAAQLDAVGVAPPASKDDPGFGEWVAATRALSLPTSASSFGTYEREDYGFDLFQAHQTFFVALPPFNLTLLRGEFDQDAVREALETAGFKTVDVGGHELLSLRGENVMDIDGPAGFRMAGMNFAVFLDDGTLAFASAGEPLAAVLDVAAGTAPSMLELAGVSELVAQAPTDLASATLVQGVDLGGGIPASIIDATALPDIDVVATEAAARGEMPPVVLALLGSTVGGPLKVDDTPVELLPGAPDARAVAILMVPDPGLAEAAVPVVEERLAMEQSVESGEPFAEIFPERSVAAVPGTPVLVVDLTLGPDVSPNILVNMFYNRDLGFLVWW
jgi:hypothetical protein